MNFNLVTNLSKNIKIYKQKNSLVSLEILKDALPSGVYTRDIDNDNEDEVIFMRNYSIPDQVEICAFEPLEGGGVKKHYSEIVVPRSYRFVDIRLSRSCQKCIFKFLNLNKKGLFLYEIDEKQNLIGSSEITGFDFSSIKNKSEYSPCLVDLDKDGKSELLIVFKATYKRYPRGIMCVDLNSRKITWSLFFGAYVEGIVCKDINGNGKREIILATSANNNGANLNGISDSYSYVIVLSSKGKIIWKRKLGRYYTRTKVVVSDWENEYKPEIICAMECHRAQSDFQGKIFLLNALTGNLKASFSQPDGYFSLPVIEKTKSKRPSIFAGDSLGRIWKFNHRLEPERKVYENSLIRVFSQWWNTDMTRYVFAVKKSEILAYNLKLNKKIFSFNIAENHKYFPEAGVPRLIPLTAKNGKNALVVADKLYLAQLAEKKKYSIAGFLKEKNSFFSFFLLLFLNLFFFSLIKNQLKIPDRKMKGDDSVKVYELIQRIAHQIKTPISTTMWTAEKMKRDLNKINNTEARKSFSQLSEFVLEDVRSLRQLSNSIMKIIQIQDPKFKITCLSALFEEMVSNYRELMKDKIIFELNIDEDIQLDLDEALFREAMINLIDNAIESMQEGGKLIISGLAIKSVITGVMKEVLIEIEDTGCGMDDQDRMHVFDPFYSRKENGSGIGLTICKRIVEVHGGKIDIISRREFGTKIAVTIPVKK